MGLLNDAYDKADEVAKQKEMEKKAQEIAKKEAEKNS